MPETFLGLAGEDWRAVGLSLRVATAAVVLSLPPGLALGWVLARKEFPGKTFTEAMLNLPLVLPPVVTGYLLLVLMGRNGWVGGWLYRVLGLEIAFTWRAAVISAGVMGFPLLVRAVRLAFQGLDPRLEQAARSLGAGPWSAFWTVSLPLARNGVIAGIVLSFARGLGEFGATLLFAGDSDQTRTISLAIRDLFDQPSDAARVRLWRLVIVAVLLACAAVGISEYLERRGRRRESA
jgi:molybdate transport system permease protein